MSNFCTQCWSSHSQGVHAVGLRVSCLACGVVFYSKAAFRRHMKDPTSQCAITEFHCCDCDLGFSSSTTLYQHLAAAHPNSTRPPARIRGVNYCDQCDKDFKTPKGLQSHLANARVHNPLLKKKVGCVGGCKRKFDAPSSLLAHLESGLCKSGITRDKLDNAMIGQDRTNIITNPDAVLARQTRNLSLTDSDFSSICDTPDDSSDAETYDGLPRFYTAGGVPLTPDASSNEASCSGDSTGTATPTASVGGSGGIPINTPPFSATSFSSTDNFYTPSASSIASDHPAADLTIEQLRSWLLPDGTFECPICPNPKPSFPTFAKLQTHMQSPVAHLQPNDSLYTPFPDPHDPPISIASSESGMVTPSTIPAQLYLLPNGKYGCPMCPLGSQKQFKSLAPLRNHMLSPIAHMPKIYNCPDPELLGIAVGAKGKKPKRSFLTLSAVTQHVESGVCQGGKSMFGAVVGFLNEKFTDMGLGDTGMIAAE